MLCYTSLEVLVLTEREEEEKKEEPETKKGERK